MFLRVVLLLPVLSFSSLFAQQQASAPPQTARQALVEMFTGGQKAVGKHLTVEVQQLLAKAGPRSAALMGAFGSVQGEMKEAQTFESGPVLLVINQPRDHAKMEIRVENDDLSGDEDTLELSLHMLRENSDQPPEDWEAFFSHLTVNMKKQAGIWRLNKIGVGLEFPIGDPEFLQKNFLKGFEQAGGTDAVAAGSHVELKTDTPERNLSPEQLLTSVAMVESVFARQHPEIGFSCSFSDLGEISQPLGLDQLSSGLYQGYKVSLAGCLGRPAGSFQIVAEPAAQGNGGKAYCTDATHNIRTSDDGRGATCLISGKSPRADAEEGSVGFDVITTGTKKSQEK